jgi:hypothetical protein
LSGLPQSRDPPSSFPISSFHQPAKWSLAMCGSLFSRPEPVLISFFRRERCLLRPPISLDRYKNSRRKRLVNLDRANKRVKSLLLDNKSVSDVTFVQEIECEPERTGIRPRTASVHARPGKRSRGIISRRSCPIVIVTSTGLGRLIRQRKGRPSVER